MLSFALIWAASAAVTAPLALPDAATAVCAAVVDDSEAARLLAQTIAGKAKKLRDNRDWPGAVTALRIAAALQPRDGALWHDLAVLELQSGQALAAEHAWQVAIAGQPDLSSGRIAYAEFLIARSLGPDLDRAAELLSRAGREPTVACLAAKVAALRGACDDSDRLAEGCAKTVRKSLKAIQAELALARARCRFESGEYDVAEKILESAQSAGADATKQLAELSEARRKAAVEIAPASRQAAATAVEIARRALLQLDKGQEPPDVSLVSAMQQAPLTAIGHAALAELAAFQKDQQRAETHWLRALNLPMADADRGRALAGLGQLYLKWSPVSRLAEGTHCLAAAHAAADLSLALKLELLLALRKTGQLLAAHKLVLAVLRQAGNGTLELSAAQQRELHAQRLAIEGARGEFKAADQGPEPPTAASDPRSRARSLAQRDRYAEAIAVLLQASRDHDASSDLLRELARYQRAMGDNVGAIDTLRKSVEKQSNDGELQWLLGRWLLDSGQIAAAHRHIRRAESLGVLSAAPLAVRADLDLLLEESALASITERHALHALRSRLDHHVARAAADHGGQAESPEVVALRRAIEGELAAGDRLSMLLMALLVAVTASALWWRHGGTDLRTLVIAHPDTGAEVQHILAAVRHEVLKHNTLQLAHVVVHLDADRQDAARTVLASIGSEGDTAHQRLLDYAGQLQRIGRARGLRLNLRRRDPAFSALFAGFDLLAQPLRRLRQDRALSTRSRAQLQARLRKAMRLLNANAYNAITTLLDVMRLLRLDRELCQAAFDQVRAEPACGQLTIAQLDFVSDDAELCVAMPRQALTEVVVNLLRNAIAASAGLTPVRVGVHLSSEVSTVTALEYTTLAVVDMAPDLELQQIHNQPADRGLGLVSALVGHYGGGLDIRHQRSPWTKAIVVRLPRAFPTAHIALEAANAIHKTA